jgi:hypothetical protein
MAHFVGEVEGAGLSTIYTVKGITGLLGKGTAVATGSDLAIDVAARRVPLRVGTKQAILDAQRAADGKLYDPHTYVEILEGAGHFGHRPGFEWWRTRQIAREQGWTRQDLIEFENDPTHYFYEDPYANMSHMWEMPR